jgi:hypothetical protein
MNQNGDMEQVPDSVPPVLKWPVNLASIWGILLDICGLMGSFARNGGGGGTAIHMLKILDAPVENLVAQELHLGAADLNANVATCTSYYHELVLINCM